ncbi:efflux RND transporter periplasmic adaptor subunit [Maribacter sp. 2307UL18-2]|uniref:efflux RND transporter periplasmic adaptor subunit n=1 Tax=Maribacter sp. 2307UL18-2 TaxID=3386274 RepID=UPI0039BCE345
MKKRIIALLVLLIVCYSCGEKKSAETTTETEYTEGSITLSEAQFTNSGMTLGSLEEKSFPVTIAVNGMIDVPPENRAVVNATLGGYIKRTPLLIGDVVKKGQLLVTVENPEFITLQQEYMEVKQQLAYLKSEYDRQQTLMDEKITSQKSLLRAESEYKSAYAKYKGLKKQLQMLNISSAEVEKGNISSVASIFAPIGGSITQVNISKGSYVSPASPILEIIDNDHIHLELSVFEKDIMNIKKGQPIRFRIPEASKKTFQAEVYLIGTSIDENRTIKVHAHLKKEGANNFLTGMFVDAEIITENTTAKAVASAAIVEQDDKFYILRKLDQKANTYNFETIEIQPGKVFEGYTEIKNADSFSTSDRFLTKGAFDVFGE